MAVPMSDPGPAGHLGTWGMGQWYGKTPSLLCTESYKAPSHHSLPSSHVRLHHSHVLREILVHWGLGRAEPHATWTEKFSARTPKGVVVGLMWKWVHVLLTAPGLAPAESTCSKEQPLAEPWGPACLAGLVPLLCPTWGPRSPRMGQGHGS